MPIVVDAEAVAARRFAASVPGVTDRGAAGAFHVTRYIGVLPDNVRHLEPGGGPDHGEADGLPQAFFVEQPAGAVVAPHFHETPQFQVIVGGGGRLGKQAVAPLAMHFAGAHTPYGPIEAGPDGIRYITLRAHWDPGAHPMPEHRAHLKPVRRRYHLAGCAPSLNDPEAPRRKDLIAPEDDGLAASLFTLPSDAEAVLALSGGGAGRFALLIAGSAICEGEALAPRACLYSHAGEAPLSVTAGPDGAALLAMRFPSDPSHRAAAPDGHP